MSTFTSGAMNQLGDALERAGFESEDVTKLRGLVTLLDVLDVLHGLAKIQNVAEDVIDCAADPLIPVGWGLSEHKRSGRFRWDPANVALYVSTTQRAGEFIRGVDLREELHNLPVLNACVLDFLFAHPQLIPEEWKGKHVYFWGTIYYTEGTDQVVRFLGWSDERGWYWDYFSIEAPWGHCSPAAIRVS